MPVTDLDTFDTVEDVRTYMNDFRGSKTYGFEYLQLCLNSQATEPEVLRTPEPTPEPEPAPEL